MKALIIRRSERFVWSSLNLRDFDQIEVEQFYYDLTTHVRQFVKTTKLFN